MPKDTYFGIDPFEQFDREYEHDHQFSVVKNSGIIDWTNVDETNIVASVAGLAAHIMNKQVDISENFQYEIGGGIR